MSMNGGQLLENLDAGIMCCLSKAPTQKMGDVDGVSSISSCRNGHHIKEVWELCSANLRGKSGRNANSRPLCESMHLSQSRVWISWSGRGCATGISIACSLIKVGRGPSSGNLVVLRHLQSLLSLCCQGLAPDESKFQRFA
jgi:hypothetical protein